MTVFDAYRIFFAAHAPHGPLLFDADEPTATGYDIWAVCVCGAEWSRWVSITDVLADADTEKASARVRKWPERWGRDANTPTEDKRAFCRRSTTTTGRLW